MIVVYPYCLKDQELALNLARWMVELDGPGALSKHKVITLADRRVDLGVSQQIQDVLKQTFGSLEHQVFMHDFWNKWAESPNKMIGFIGRQLLDSPWMWLEPDVVPMRKGWLDKLEAEYLACGKPFMGDRVDVENVPLHMSGVGFYPAEVIEHAGSMLNAHEIAWDVQAAPQIVPQAHWTEQLVHNWKHEAFTSTGELDNLRGQHPQMQLFHADKAHSIIPMLRAELSGTLKKPYPEQSATTEPLLHDGRVSSGNPSPVVAGNAPPAQLSCDIFIKSYPPDYPWLAYCLRSIEKFATGFRKTVIIYPKEEDTFPPLMGEIETVALLVGEQPDGYLWQMVIKLDADRYTDASHILYIDSDTIFTKPVTPADYMRFDFGSDHINGKVVWMLTPYEKVTTPWQQVIEKFLKKPVAFEFMRRQPFLVPRWLLSELRAFCEREHGVTLDAYVLSQPHRAFSEFNALGAFAYEFFRDEFVWVNTEEVSPSDWPVLTVLQSWSRGGLTDEIKKRYEEILDGETSVVPRIGDNGGEEVQGNGEEDAPTPQPAETSLPTLATDHATHVKIHMEEVEQIAPRLLVPVRLSMGAAKWDRVEQLVLELKGYCDSPVATARVRKAVVGGKIFPPDTINWIQRRKWGKKLQRKRKRNQVS